MSTSAKVVADSISPLGHRITTLQLVFPRIILAEFNTHRMFSRNAASSRAIPVQKMMEQIRTDPFIPKYWGANQPGMQASQELHDEVVPVAREYWLLARDEALASAEVLRKLNVHKQLANRILEPWMWSHVVVTATEWGNFFNLRLHPDAQPEMQELAQAMWNAMQASTPVLLGPDAWHLPYVKADEGDQATDLNLLRALSVARCARVSYMNHDGTEPDVAKDIVLHDRLATSGHWSPFEHQATPSFPHEKTANFRGWTQYRSWFGNENRTDFKGP